MTDKQDSWQPSAGSLGLALGLLLTFLSAMLFVNRIEGEPFAIGSALAAAGALYYVVAGAVARGIQLARRY